MTLKIYTTEVECVDEELQESIFVVKAFDEYLAEVDIKGSVYTLASWKELAKSVEKAIKRLELKE